MRLFLIRHGETVDNVAHVYAGSRDSALTSHGVNQARRLAAHLAASGVAASHVFSSDLQRAAKTAQIVCDAQQRERLAVVRLPELREKDFGSAEGVKFGVPVAADEAGFVGAETAEAMKTRVDRFIDQHLSPLLSGSSTCIVVAHGIILSVLFKALCTRLAPSGITASAEAQRSGSSGASGLIPSWRNTGYLEASIASSHSWSQAKMHLEQVNCTTHLVGLKRTGGGVGSAAFDERQKTMDAFFSRGSKRKSDDAR